MNGASAGLRGKFRDSRFTVPHTRQRTRQTEDAGLRVAEDPSEDRDRPETVESASIVETTVLPDAEIIPENFEGEDKIPSKATNTLWR